MGLWFLPGEGRCEHFHPYPLPAHCSCMGAMHWVIAMRWAIHFQLCSLVNTEISFGRFNLNRFSSAKMKEKRKKNTQNKYILKTNQDNDQCVQLSEVFPSTQYSCECHLLLVTTGPDICILPPPPLGQMPEVCCPWRQGSLPWVSQTWSCWQLLNVCVTS